MHAGYVVGLDYQNPYMSIYEEFRPRAFLGPNAP